MADFNLGPFRLNPRGEFNPTTKYRFCDLVSYNGSSYMCINDDTIDGVACIGILPEGSEESNKYFQCIAKKGDKGDIADKYDEFNTLTSDTWDYSNGDKIVIDDDSITEINITNVYDGCVGMIITKNGNLILPSNSDYSYDFYFVNATGDQYYMYTFVYLSNVFGKSKFIWNRTVIVPDEIQ